MSSPSTVAAGERASALPSYVAAATPVPQANRIPWYLSTAQTYAGIMLWFVFWQDVPTAAVANPGGALAQGLGLALVALLVAALLCHYLYYLVPGMMGMKTGLPLYIVGTSTYGVQGGLVMPGLLMGLLQFGWLGVNAFATGSLLCGPFFKGGPDAAMGTVAHWIVASLFAVGAAFLGLKGIQYVAKVATFLPLIPLAILVILLGATVTGIGGFSAQSLVDSAKGAAVAADTGAAVPAALTKWGVLAMMVTYVAGFFATAGAAGADFGMNNRNARDVQLGGLVGIAGATLFAGGLSLLIVAGAFGSSTIQTDPTVLKTTSLMSGIMGSKYSSVFMYLLAIAAFPPACFSAFIAANSFKTTLPKINPYITVGLGTLVSIGLVVTGAAAQVGGVFQVIGASFGPICGAMAADYLLAGRKWAGPRASFNPAGWISWAAGFVVGGFNLVMGSLGSHGYEWAQPLSGIIPVPPVAAFVVGFVLYLLLAKAGLESRTLKMPQAKAR